MTAGETAAVPFALKCSVNDAPPAGCTART